MDIPCKVLQRKSKCCRKETWPEKNRKNLKVSLRNIKDPVWAYFVNLTRYFGINKQNLMFLCHLMIRTDNEWLVIMNEKWKNVLPIFTKAKNGCSSLWWWTVVLLTGGTSSPPTILEPLAIFSTPHLHPPTIEIWWF